MYLRTYICICVWSRGSNRQGGRRLGGGVSSPALLDRDGLRLTPYRASSGLGYTVGTGYGSTSEARNGEGPDRRPYPLPTPRPPTMTKVGF